MKKRTIYQRKSAFDKREKTLGKAYANRNKKGKFTFSRPKQNLSQDERRQATLDARESNSQSFVLTHKGVPIKDLKRNTHAVDEDEDTGVIEADFVNELHFGGGLLSTQNGGQPMSFKDKMHDLIQRSKQKKAGHQLHQEEVHANVMKADEGWQQTMQQLSTAFNNSGSKFKQRVRENAMMRRKQAMMEMDSVVNFLQTSGVSSSGGYIKEKEDATSNNRGLDRLSQYLETKAGESADENSDEKSDEEEENGEEAMDARSTKPKSQPFLEVLHCLDILVNMNDEKHIQALTCLCQNIARPIRTMYRLAGGLLITSSISKATIERGKFSTELNRFLLIVLNMAIPCGQRCRDYCMPPSSTPSFLEVTKRMSDDFVMDEEQALTVLKSFVAKDTSVSAEELRLHALALTFFLLERLVLACQQAFRRGAPELLQPFKQRLTLLPTENYPLPLKRRADDVLKLIEDTLDSTRERPAMQWTEPLHKEIEMIEPIFGEELIASKRASKANKRTPLTANEKTRLLKKKVKSERKSTMRELRRDTEYLQTIKRKEQARKDKERKRKVAKIMGDLAMQEGDYRKLSSRKKR